MFNLSELRFSNVTSYKIHTLVQYRNFFCIWQNGWLSCESMFVPKVEVLSLKVHVGYFSTATASNLDATSIALQFVFTQLSIFYQLRHVSKIVANKKQITAEFFKIVRLNLVINQLTSAIVYSLLSYEFNRCFHQFVSRILFHEFFSVWAVEKENKLLIGPKQVFFSVCQLKKKS